MKSQCTANHILIYLFIVIFTQVFMFCTPPLEHPERPSKEDHIGELWISLIPPSLDDEGLDTSYNAIESYSITLENPDQSSINKDSITDFPVIFEMIPTGTWTVSGYAINGRGEPVGEKITTITIKEYERTEIELSLNLLDEGNGLLSVVFTWPEDAVTAVDAQLKKEEEPDEEITFYLPDNNKEALYSDNTIPAGRYTLTAKLMNDSYDLITVVEDFTIYGNLKTVISAEFTMEDLSTRPEKPTGLLAEEGNWCINLSWVDNSHKEMRYVVERSREPSSNFETLKNLAANTISYTDTSAIPNTIYYYRVYAVNRYGDSDCSNVAAGMVGIPFPPFDLDLPEADDTGIDHADNITQKHTLTISGKSENDTTVTLINNITSQTIVSDITVENGLWETSITLGDGEYEISAVAVDPVKNTSNLADPISLTIDSAAPATPDLSGPLGTYDLRPAWDFTLPGDGVLFQHRLNGGTWEEESDYFINGTYRPDSDLESNNSYTLDIQVQDTAGNWSQSAGYTIYIIGDDFGGMTLKGSWDRPYGVPAGEVVDFAIHSNYIYIATDQDLRIFDITQQQSPQYVTTISFPPGDEYQTLKVISTYLYIINTDATLLVYDLSTPSAPFFLKEIAFSSVTGDADFYMSVYGNSLYIVNSQKGLYIFDLTDPSDPSPLGNTVGLSLPGVFSQFCRYGTTGYLASQDEGIYILDLSNQASPLQTGTIATTGAVKDLATTGATLYAADSVDGIIVFNITTPATPAKEDTFQSADILGLQPDGNILYTANGTTGFMVYTITNPLSPVHTRDIQVKFTSYDLEVMNDYLYLNSSQGGIEIYDRSTPASPVFYSRIPVKGEPGAAYATSTTAFLSDGLFGVKIIDITDPVSPTLISAFETGGAVREVYSDGTYLYLGDDTEGFLIYTVTNPSQPVLKGKYSMEEISTFYIDETIAYILTDKASLYIIDITNPVSPGHLYDGKLIGQPKDIVLKNSYAYITNCSEGTTMDLIVLNVTDPSHPADIQFINTDPLASGVYVSGNFLFAGHEGGSVSKIKITDPGKIEIDQGNSSFTSVPGISGAGPFLFVHDDEANTITALHTFDINTTVPNGVYTYDKTVNSLFASDSYIYLTIEQNEQVLYILEYE